MVGAMKMLNDADRPLYNSRIVDLFIQMVKAEYPHVDTGRLMAESGIKAYEVTDLGHWFTQAQMDRFVERLVQLTGNEGISREAGRYAASAQILGPMRKRILGVISPAKAFALVNKAGRHITKSVCYETQVTGANEIEVVVAPRAGVMEKPHHCEKRFGFFEELVKILHVDSPEIEHTECVHRGADSCRYRITWNQGRAATWFRHRRVAVAVAAVVNLAGLLFFPPATLMWLLPLSLFTLLSFVVWGDHLEKQELRAGVEDLRESTEGLIDQLNVSYNNSQLAAEVGQVISQKTDMKGILAAVGRVLHERLDFDRGAILLANESRTRLTLKTAYGFAEQMTQRPERFRFHLDRPGSNGVFVQAFKERMPLLVDDVGEITDRLSPRSLGLMRETGTKSFISCPIICDGESIGVLVVDNHRSQRPLSKNDMALLMGITPIIGISIHNARLLEQRAKQFNSTLQVLSASIDARDFMTAGHSEKVTKYSVGICKELGLSAEDTEVIRVAAMLHDYGKIGVPDFILKKNGRLTEEERALVQTHPGKTRDILESINFQGHYKQVPKIAGSHHEKVDGTGYPQGLKGDEIPLGSKIIAVADFFEAITAKRHYRDPMSVEMAMTHLRDGSGTHFDPVIVGALINYVTQSQEFILNEDKSRVRFFHRHVRVPCRSDVSCRSDQRTISGASSNLSMGGLFIAADADVVKGDLIDVVFSLPKYPDRLIKAKARVAWVNPRKRVSPLPVGFGVQFVDLREEDSLEIRDYVGQVCVAA